MDIKLVNKKEKLTDKVLAYKQRKRLSDDALAEVLGISRMTLLKRKEDHDWSITQAFYIQQKF